MLKALIPFLIATVIAAGLGFGATKMPGPSFAKATPDAAASAKAGDHGAAAAGGHGAPADKGAKPADKGGDKHGGKGAAPATVEGVLTLPPIVGPLRAPAQVWVRFEGVVVVDTMDAQKAKTLVAEIADDSLVYFAAVSLPEIEGSAGLKAVKEDLTERARIRGEGKVREVLIQTMVTQ